MTGEPDMAELMEAAERITSGVDPALRATEGHVTIASLEEELKTVRTAVARQYEDGNISEPVRTGALTTVAVLRQALDDAQRLEEQRGEGR